MHHIFLIQSARTCCVSIEVAPFLPLLFTASISSAESVQTSPCDPGDNIPLGWFIIQVDHAQSRRVSCSICLVRSILAHTSLLMSGGAIPANKYKSSTYVDLRHPVIVRYALVSSGSNISAYADLPILEQHIPLLSSTGPVPLFL